MINIYLGKKFKERRIELKISLKHAEAYTQISENIYYAQIQKRKIHRATKE